MYVYAKAAEQLRARELRRQGGSLRQIARELGVALSSVSNWVRDIPRGTPRAEPAEAARRMLRYAFEELNLNRVMLRVNRSNIGGMKAYEAAGFVQEGVLRQAAFVDGELDDMLVMSVLHARQVEILFPVRTLFLKR